MRIKSIFPKGIHLPVDFSTIEYCNVTYMCIKEPYGEVQIPDNFRYVIESMLRHITFYADKYLYVTIKRQHVKPHTSGNRDGWHIDGFLSNDRSWVWCDSLPTLVATGDFEVDADHEKSLRQFSRQVNKVHAVSPNHLYELGDCVHKPMENNSDSVVLRTFVKVVESPEIFNGIGNAWNYKLPHIKPNKQRGESRNHTVV